MCVHDLRHNAATLFLGMGMHPRVVQELLGHSNISTTLGLYGHVILGMQEEAMEKWKDFLLKDHPDKEDKL